MNEIIAVPINESMPLTAVQVKAQVQLIQQVMQAVMISGIHYGTIPGCGDKPVLLKPGAEKLFMTFHIADEPHIEDLSGEDEIRYRIITKALSIEGKFLGSGMGECSSLEEKFKWRRAVCEEEWNETAEDRRRQKWARGKEGKNYQIKQVRTNKSDMANTVLKMADKRACVAMCLKVTAASDIFIQDLEEMEPELAESLGGENGGNKVAPVAMPRKLVAFDRKQMKNIVTKFDSICSECSGTIAKGEIVLYDALVKKIVHKDPCREPEQDMRKEAISGDGAIIGKDGLSIKF